MAFAGKNPFKIARQLWSVGGFDKQTLAGDLTLTHKDSQMIGLDPGGSNRTITLPAPVNGAWFAIFNLADAAEDLVIEHADGSTTMTTANRNECAIVYALDDKASDAADGWDVLAIVTISPS